MRRAIVLLALGLLACAPPPGSSDGGAGADAGADGGALDGGLADGGDGSVDGGDERPDALALLDEIEDYALLAGDRGTVKYLAPVEGAPPQAPIGEACAFQNTARYPFHLQFLRTLPGGEELTFDDYIALVLRRDTRAWWGGELLWRPNATHPLTGEAGVLVFSLYTEDSPGNRLVIDDVRAVHAAMRACAPAFADSLAFAPSSAEQRQTAQQIQPTLEAEGIAVLLDP